MNASGARYVRLSLGGKPFQIIGTDGGLIEAPVTVTEVLLPAADRVELAVGPFETEGAVLNIDDLPYYRMARKKGVEGCGTVRVTTRSHPQRACQHGCAKLSRSSPVTQS